MTKRNNGRNSNKPNSNKSHSNRSGKVSENANKHFQKHGSSMGITRGREYVERANEVKSYKKTQHKKSQGKDIYYHEPSNSFVVERRGTLVTFFKPDSGENYYKKQ